MAINPQSTEPFLGGPMSVETYLQLENMACDRKYEYLGGTADGGLTQSHHNQ
jgi:hypothetical protein